MGQWDIKRRLKRYAAACEKVAPEEKEYRIREILQAGIEQKNMSDGAIRQTAGPVPIRRTRGSLLDFIVEQIGYLGRYCLFWQAVWIAVFYYMVRCGVLHLFERDNENAVLTAISILPPLLVLLTVEEVTKVYQRSMLEIEYATKYSLRSVVMIRMLVLCVVHSLILMICIARLSSDAGAEMGRLLVYGFTPMTIVAALLFKIMQYWQGELLRVSVTGLYVVAAGLIIAGNAGYFNWYHPAYFKVWCIVCAIGIVYGVRQLICLNRKLASYEAIVQ